VLTAVLEGDLMCIIGFVQNCSLLLPLFFGYLPSISIQNMNEVMGMVISPILSMKRPAAVSLAARNLAK
jgi:hypothetical protein